MPKDYVKLTAKTMIRKGNIQEAITYLIQTNGKRIFWKI